MGTINRRRGQNYDSLKDKQTEVLKQVVEGKDVIAALKTGFGKRLYIR